MSPRANHLSACEMPRVSPRMSQAGAERAIATLALWILIAAGAGAADYQAPGTKRMAERLEKIAQDVNLMRAEFQSRGRAEMIRTMLPRLDRLSDRVNYQQQLAYDLLNSGLCEEAIEQYAAFERLVTTEAPDYWTQVKPETRIRQAMCHLRLGEV